jgi:hypothetical protein
VKKMTNLNTNKKLGKIFLILTLFLLISASFMKFAAAEDEEDEGDEDDKGKSMGTAAFGLFGISLIYPFFFQIQRVTMKLNKKKERNIKIKQGYQKFLKVVRKPLQWIHYLTALAAIVLFSLHGASMLPEDNEQAVLGIISGSLLLFYAFTGILLKLILPKIKNATKFRKVMFAIHTSFILIMIALGILFAHVAGD